MDDIFWLLCANIAFWLGMGAYALFLGVRQGRIERKLQQLEILNNERTNR